MKGVNNRGNLGKGESYMKILSYFEQFFYKLKTALKNRLLIDFLKSRFPASEKLKDLATLNPYAFWWQMKL